MTLDDRFPPDQKPECWETYSGSYGTGTLAANPCTECGALVGVNQRQAHSDWHDGLQASTSVKDPFAGPRTIEDGFGSEWELCNRPDCGLEVVRPGKVQCWCDSEDGDESEPA